MGAPSFIAAFSGTFDGTSLITVTHPPEAGGGDTLVVAIATLTDSAVVTPPAGWTSRVAKSITSPAPYTIALLEYQVPASAPVSHEFSVSGVSSTEAICGGCVYRGAGALNGAAATTEDTPATTAHIVAVLNPVDSDSRTIGIVCGGSSATWTPPFSPTERVDRQTNVNAAATLTVMDEATGGFTFGGDAAVSSSPLDSFAVSVELRLAGSSRPAVAGVVPETTPGGIGLV